MLSVVNYKYDDNCVRDIENWAFGKNWPAVYIAYNENKAYVGETLDAVRRTKQHLAEDTFKDLFADPLFFQHVQFMDGVIDFIKRYSNKSIR